jgi:L-lactate dehydrogenase complex protein LldE
MFHLRNGNAPSRAGTRSKPAFAPRRLPGALVAPRTAEHVQLFATCLGDLAFPDAAADAESLLTAAGLQVDFPRSQVCCGQPAFNAGHRAAARRVARGFARAFDRKLPIVCPSGSCAAMVAHHLPDLIGQPPYEIWELSAFLDARGASVPKLNSKRRLAYHDSCHMLRELGVRDAPRRLLKASGGTLVELPRPDLCCGFGGTFSIRQPEISVALADEKLSGAAAAEALVTADPGCLMQLRGRSERIGALPVVHLATALARGVAA